MLCPWIKIFKGHILPVKSLHSCLSSLIGLTYSLTTFQSNRSINCHRTNCILFNFSLFPHECHTPLPQVLLLFSRVISCVIFSMNLFLIVWPAIISFSFKCLSFFVLLLCFSYSTLYYFVLVLPTLWVPGKHRLCKQTQCLVQCVNRSWISITVYWINE